MRVSAYVRHLFHRAGTIALAGLFGVAASAIELDLSQVPMDVQEGVDPNIIFTFDDSGSMRRAFLPENVDNLYGGDDPQYRSSTVNLIYYDPDVAAAGGYIPAVDENGNSLGDMDFNNACLDGILKIECNQNLNNYVPTLTCDTGDTTCDTTGSVGQPYYYRYEPATTGCSPADVTNANCFKGYNLVTAQEKQQFANWFSYYRIRHLMAKTAASRAFAQLSPSVRVAWQRLNGGWPGLLRSFSGTNRTDFFDWLYNVPTSGWTPLHRAFNRAGRRYQETGINSPYAKEPGVTQDPEYACRQNFHIAFTDGEWNQHHWMDPENSNGINEVDDASFALPANAYGVSGYSPRPPYRGPEDRYLADIAMYYWATDLRPDLDDKVPEYIVDKTGTSADIFWNPRNDPATWQHMVTFTVSLGLSGNRVFDPSDPWGGGDFPALAAGTLQWGPNPVDDLWHAAVNGRGGYFTAANPQQLVDSFTSILNAIASRTGSATAPATSFPLFASGTLLYMPRFDTGDWTGDLVAIDVQDVINQLIANNGVASGTLSLAELDAIARWKARDVLEGQTSRTIITWDPDTRTGIPFSWSAMQSGGTLQTLLDQDDYGVSGRGPDRVAYFRGDRSKEGSSDPTTQFRIRQYLLGDIVNSTPQLVGPAGRLYPDDLESKKYSEFKDTMCTRNRRLYVGANDGMLHVFDAGTFDCQTQAGTPGTGEEIMAYLPSPVYRNLYKLTSFNYTHRFFVDGPPVVEDVFINGDWRTVLVGGLNAGGQGIYALDITTGNFSEGAAATHVLWEFTDVDDADLGYTFAQPRVAKTNLSAGNWAVLVGNGYNNTEDDTAVGGKKSSTGNAVLFVLDMQTGSVLAKLDTGVGESDPACNNRPNGLATVAAVDENRDYKVDYAYAGDLCGNLWRFDLTDNQANRWSVKKVFVASYQSGGTTKYQPITTSPRVILHPSEGGFIVLVGTGKHLELSDLADTSINTVYGVWDDPNRTRAAFDRNALYQQKFLDFTDTQFTLNEGRTSTKGSFDWYTGNGLPSPTSGAYLGWYLDLQTPDGSGGYLQEGEKMVKTMLVRGSNLVFVSDVPSPDPCDAGGSSWINEINAVTGSRLNETPFDYNLDGVRENKGSGDGGDLIQSATEGENVAGSSIRRKGGGTVSSPAVLTPTTCATGMPCDEKKIFSRADGGMDVADENPDKSTLGRRSWRQIFAP